MFRKKGLAKFSIAAFILSLFIPVIGLALCVVYNDKLNPGIRKSAGAGLLGFFAILVIIFIVGFIVGLTENASI